MTCLSHHPRATCSNLLPPHLRDLLLLLQQPETFPRIPFFETPGVGQSDPFSTQGPLPLLLPQIC